MELSMGTVVTSQVASRLSQSIQGVGIGLRSQHYAHILTHQPDIPWLEALSDNYLGGGLPLHHLEQIRAIYPLTLHGVGLSLGSVDPINLDYLARLKTLADRIEPAHISDHLCWSSVQGNYFNDLAPLPYTETVLDYVAERILQVQDFLGCRILVENLSPYLQFRHNSLTEWDFIAALLDKADCYLLLDINNVYVNATNHGFDPLDYLLAIPPERVKEIHLAGYEDQGGFLFDTHGYPVQTGVWQLYQVALERFGSVPTLIEWDTDIPAFEVLMAEAEKALAYWPQA